MNQMSIRAETVDDIVSGAWNAVIKKANNGHPLSSEKTLCFLFAMALSEKVGPTLVVDFENQCYDSLEGNSKYLDLLFYTNISFKVAVKFKFPRRSLSGASNQPQTRQAIYRDIARLYYLKDHSVKAGACYFLMMLNEHAYLNKGNYRINAGLQVHHGHKVIASNALTASGLSLAGVEFEFKWRMTKQSGNGKHVCDGSYAWLDPIKV